MKRALLMIVAAATALTWVPAASGARASVSDDWTQRRVLNVAHAGGDLEAPHSTLFAMKSAVLGGADIIEIDVRLSADGRLVVQHDDTVDRTTNGTGAVGDKSLAELRVLDNAYWFVPNCWSCHDRDPSAYELRGMRTGDRVPPPGFTRADFGIPTLAEVVHTFPGRVLDIEIKGDSPGAYPTADALASFIARRGIAERVVVAAFDDDLLAHFKAAAPTVATSPGLDETTRWFVERGPLPDHRVIQVPPTFSGIEVVTRQFVADAHANGLAVWVWFNGEGDDVPEVWAKLLDDGVDALLTGHPAAAQSLIDERGLGFRAAPEVAGTAALRHGKALLSVACPSRHVARCESRIALVARDRRGNDVLVGLADMVVGRNRTSVVRVPIAGWLRRATRDGAVTVQALMFPLNADTDAGLSTFGLHR